MEWIKSSLWEIKKSSSLRLFGAALAVAHIMTYGYWAWNGDLPLKYYSEGTPVCWSFFEGCAHFRFFPIGLVNFIYFAYVVFAVAAGALFFSTRTALPGWLLMLGLFVFKMFLYVQDFRLSGNEHYILFLLTFVFLFVPNKETAFKAIIISIYLVSGLLKLSPDWLTGQWFLTHHVMHAKLAEWFAALSAIIELIAPLALLMRPIKYFATGMLVLIAYHVITWYEGDFFSPGIMLIALSFFLFNYFEQRRNEMDYAYQSYLRPEPSRVWVFVLLVFFWGAQVVPRWFHDGSRWATITEIFAFNRNATDTECDQATFLIYDNRVEEVVITPPPGRAESQSCNPYFRFLDARFLCQKHQNDEGFRTVLSILKVRKLKDKQFKDAFEIPDACDPKFNYRSLGSRSWNTQVTAAL